MNKRALLVTWHYPPSSAVGARRPAQLATGLSDHGWEVTVLCPRQHGSSSSRPGTVIETPRARPSEWIRRLLPRDDRPLFEQLTGAPSQKPQGGDTRWLPRAVRQARSLLIFPDEHAPWIAAARHTAIRQLEGTSFDVVISSTPPFSTVVAGAALARHFRCPHVVDVRDPFTLNAIWPPGRLDRPLRRALETKLLDQAARVVTVSEGFANKQRTLTSTPVEVIHNAYNPADVIHSVPPPLEDTVHLVHTGTIYPATVNLDAFAEGVAACDRNIRIINCGKSGEVLRAALQRVGLVDRLEDHGVVSPEQAAALRTQAHALLVFLPDRSDDSGHIPAKLFDYLGARRPILAVGSRDSEPAQLLARHQTQGACDSAPAVADWLQTQPDDVLLPAQNERSVSAAALCLAYASVLNDVTGC